MPDPAPAAGPLADLILCRLLVPSKAPPSERAVAAAVAPLFRDPPSPADVSATLAALRSAGLLTPRGQRLTDAGRARGLAFLGVAGLPDRCPWGQVRAKYLVPKLLGLTPGSAESYQRIATRDKLAARVLKRTLGLPTGTPDSLAGTLEALACRSLGFKEATRLADIRDAVLGGEQTKLTGSAAPAKAALEASVLCGAFEAFDLEAFAADVVSAARACETGRFGDNKVFISHVWRQVQGEPRFRAFGEDEFKAKLVEANRAGRLALSRADLVQFMDPVDVRESETSYMTATFHFIRIESEK